MKKRPLSVTIVGWLFIAVGVIALAAHLAAYKVQHPFQYDIVWIAVVEILAIVCGLYMLRGSDWARWLALAWMGFHVIFSAFHPLSELLIHSVLFAVLAYLLLFRPGARAYFRGPTTRAT